MKAVWIWWSSMNIYIHIYTYRTFFYIYIKMRWFDPILSAEIETVIPSVAWVWQQSSTLPPVFPATAGGRANHRGLVWGQTDRRRTERRAMDCHVKGGGTCQLCFGSQQANKTLPCSLAASELPRLRTSLQQTSALTRQHFPALLCFWTTAVRHLSFFSSHLWASCVTRARPAVPTSEDVRLGHAAFRARGRAVSHFCGVCVSQPAGHVQVISTRYQTAAHLNTLQDSGFIWPLRDPELMFV